MRDFIGGIAGDIIGSVYEWNNVRRLIDIELFAKTCRATDDTVLTCAVAEWLMAHKTENLSEEDSLKKLSELLLKYGKAHPHAGYGHMFRDWMNEGGTKPMGSFGNGAGMRVSPVGFIAESEEECLKLAEMSAKVTHDHPEGIKGAQAIALSIYMARNGKTKDEIKKEIEERFGYDIEKKLTDITHFYCDDWTNYVLERTHKFDATCQVTVPEAIIAFLEGDSYKQVIYKALLIGGDSDTIADMAGAIAGAYYGVPDDIAEKALSVLPDDLRDTVNKFEKFMLDKHNVNEA